MSDLSTRPPTVERTMPSHPKPQAIKGTPSLKAPPKKAMESAPCDQECCAMAYRTSGHIYHCAPVSFPARFPLGPF